MEPEPGKWCTIESDPGVFTELIKAFGVHGIQVEELSSLEEADFKEFQPIYGLIFLFKWDKKLAKKEKPAAYVPDLFFAKQVIMNACATQALISILLNLKDVNIGEHLGGFKDFAMGLTPDMRGAALENAEVIRKAHNSFSHQEPFIFEERMATEKDDVFHFVSYLNFKGKVYELDGLQEGPILIGNVDPGKDWVLVAKDEIVSRIQAYSTNEIKFNLLALVADRMEKAERDANKYRALKWEIAHRLALPTNEPSPGIDMSKFKEELDKLPTEKKELQELYKSVDSGITFLSGRPTNSPLELTKSSMVLALEAEKRKKWHDENVRRKHNYLSFIFEMLRVLAAKGELPGLIQKAKEEEAEKEKKKKAEEDAAGKKEEKKKS